jgi:hypothetical protein
MQERLDRLDLLLREDRIVRSQWRGSRDGKEVACLLAALSPEAGERKVASACPADVMPRWLAELTPSMDDSGSEREWPAFVKRYARLARRWGILSPAEWRKVEYQAQAARAAWVAQAAQVAARAAWAAAWDRINTAILDAIEQACVRAEGATSNGT